MIGQRTALTRSGIPRQKKAAIEFIKSRAGRHRYRSPFEMLYGLRAAWSRYFDYGHVGVRPVECQQLVVGFPADGEFSVVLRNVGGAAYDSRSDLDCDAHPRFVCMLSLLTRPAE